jgi:hypothetical protein
MICLMEPVAALLEEVGDPFGDELGAVVDHRDAVVVLLVVDAVLDWLALAVELASFGAIALDVDVDMDLDDLVGGEESVVDPVADAVVVVFRLDDDERDVALVIEDVLSALRLTARDELPPNDDPPFGEVDLFPNLRDKSCEIPICFAVSLPNEVAVGFLRRGPLTRPLSWPPSPATGEGECADVKTTISAAVATLSHEGRGREADGSWMVDGSWLMVERQTRSNDRRDQRIRVDGSLQGFPMHHLQPRRLGVSLAESIEGVGGKIGKRVNST